jgi:hypothetical protein
MEAVMPCHTLGVTCTAKESKSFGTIPVTVYATMKFTIPLVIQQSLSDAPGLLLSDLRHLTSSSEVKRSKWIIYLKLKIVSRQVRCIKKESMRAVVVNPDPVPHGSALIFVNWILPQIQVGKTEP